MIEEMMLKATNSALKHAYDALDSGSNQESKIFNKPKKFKSVQDDELDLLYAAGIEIIEFERQLDVDRFEGTGTYYIEKNSKDYSQHVFESVDAAIQWAFENFDLHEDTEVSDHE